MLTIIGYERRKTREARADNAWFEIRVPDIVKPIVEKYLDTSNSEFLFNFHSIQPSTGTSMEWWRCRSSGARIFTQGNGRDGRTDRGTAPCGSQQAF